MSNYLSIRRVKVQTIGTDGSPIGDPSFGVMVSDDFAQAYNDTFETVDQLNAAIAEAGSILKLVGEDLFEVATPENV